MFVSALVVCLVVLTPGALSWGSDINKDLDAFVKLIPQSKIDALVTVYYNDDPEVKVDVDYINSSEFQDQIKKLLNTNEVIAVLDSVKGCKVDVNKYIKLIEDIVDRKINSTTDPLNGGPGLKGLLAQVKPMIPMTKIKLLAAKKLVLSSQFRKFVKLLISKDFQNKVQNLLASSEVQALYTDLKIHGVDVDAISKFVQSLIPSFVSKFPELALLEQLLYFPNLD